MGSSTATACYQSAAGSSYMMEFHLSLPETFFLRVASRIDEGGRGDAVGSEKSWEG